MNYIYNYPYIGPIAELFGGSLLQRDAERALDDAEPDRLGPG